MSKKKFLLDSLLNIISMAIPIMVLQLFTLPSIGRDLGSEQYGIVVTFISLFTVVSFPFGNVLNNVRLLLDHEYTKKKYSGDFNILLVSSLVISTIMLIIGTIYYDGHFSMGSILFIVIIGALNLAREYLSVSFRLQLNYRLILMNNVMLSIGYFLGTILFQYMEIWQFVFVAGYGLSLIHIVIHTNLYMEPLKFTALFKSTTYKSIILLCSSLLRNVLSYADKLLLFPLLGPTAVTIYYTATIVSKIMLMAITPINGVILSYIARMEKINLRTFISIIVMTGFIGMIGYMITIFVSPFVLNTFYTSWAAESLKYIYITTAIGIVEMIISVINPFILKFNDINWQILINGSNIVVYTISTFLLFREYGLMGFCIGIFISSTYQLLFMIGIFIVSNRRKNLAN
ncbi:lipopolysaccharide biosynthesis protein [Lysinibacillus sp. SGAir0095]|uniref:lipopolysaccharide biosynthesis protein n=1 Tax=Lysinibacillus sp. SGAir0095 TaxID=2070463 RepID=UPI0010CD1DBD|nr:hypothetical protein [Lysinibacillus sp. SGAir0095]QCR31987.1 hypothetical protein C1N55_07295 [Lysinibacillus sp. SGAir0095]